MDKKHSKKIADGHTFSVSLASEYGLVEAILLQSLMYWTEYNMINHKHCYDGHWWTYNSRTAWQDQYPYLGEGKIRGALKRLEARGVLIRGNYNAYAYDHTTWFALTKEFVLSQNPDINWDSVLKESENSLDEITGTLVKKTRILAKISSETGQKNPTIPLQPIQPITETIAFFSPAEKKEKKERSGEAILARPSEATATTKAPPPSYRETPLPQSEQSLTSYCSRFGGNQIKVINFFNNMVLHRKTDRTGQVFRIINNHVQLFGEDVVVAAIDEVNRHLSMGMIIEYTLGYFTQALHNINKPKIEADYDTKTFIYTCCCGNRMEIDGVIPELCPQCGDGVDDTLAEDFISKIVAESQNI